MQEVELTSDEAAAGEGASDGAGKTQAAVEAAVQAAVETMNSVMSNPPEGFSKADIMQLLVSQMHSEFKAEAAPARSPRSPRAGFSGDLKPKHPGTSSAAPGTQDMKSDGGAGEVHGEAEVGASTPQRELELQAVETLDLKVDSVASSAGLSAFIWDSFGTDRMGPVTPDELRPPPVEGSPLSAGPAMGQGSAIAATQHAKSACKPDARGGPVSAPQEQAPCEQVASAAAEDPDGEPASSPSHSTQPLLPSGEQDRPASIRTHAEGVAEVDCMPSVLTPTPTSEDATTPPRPCMAEEGAGSAAPSWAGSPRLPSPPNPDRMERPHSPAPAAGAGALRRLVVASKPPRRTGAGRSAPPLPPAARAGERSRKTRPPAARPPRPSKSTLAHRDLVRGADSAAGSRRSAPVASTGCRLPPRSPAAAHSAEAAGASGDLQVVTAASRGPAPAGAAAWPLLEAAANRRERRVVVERLFRNPTACTQWHLAAVVRCLPDSVQRAFMAWTEVSGQVRSQRGRCAKAVVRETKRLLCTLCSSPAHHSTPSTAALDAALKDAIQVARSRDAALRREPRVCCGDAAETYVLMLSSFKSAQARWGARCGHAVTEIDASWMGQDSSSLTLVTGRLSSAISASLPAAAAAQPPDVGPLRPLNDSQVLLVERLAEDRRGVACMPLMRVAVGSLARASHGGGLADVLAERVRRYLHNCGGDAPALLQVPGTVTAEFEWRSRTNTGLLLPVVEFLPHFFSKGCRFDLQDVAAVEGDACLPYRARKMVLWRGARYVTVDAEAGGYAVVGEGVRGRAPSWEEVRQFCLAGGWRPKLVVYEHAA